MVTHSKEIVKYIEYLEMINSMGGLEHKVVGKNNQLGNKRRDW